MNGSTEFLGEVCEAVIESLRLVGKQDHCIDGSALLARVLQDLDFHEAYPLTVRVCILNPALVQWIDEYITAIDANRLLTCDDERAVEIRVGNATSGSHDRWGGHMVVVVPRYFGELHAILDITISQANRPDYQVSLPPFCLKANDEFVEGKCIFPLTDINGCNVFYSAFPEDRSFGRWDALLNNSWVIQTAAQHHRTTSPANVTARLL